MKNKKAQITVFIIIGLAIAIGVALFLFLSSEQADQTLAQYQLEDIPEEVQPIRDFVGTCIDQITFDSIQDIGLHGGYIDPEDPILSGKTLTFDEAEPTESDGVNIFEQKVVFWTQMDPPNTCKKCVFKNSAPTNEEIEYQIEQKLLEELPTCLNNYKTFTNEGFTIEELSQPKITLQLREKDILINMNMEVEVSKEGRVTKFEKFTSVTKFPLKEVLDIAKTINSNLFDNQALERNTLHFISLYSGIDAPMPPMFYRSEKIAVHSWSFSKVKQTAINILSMNIPLFQIEGSKDATPIESDQEPNPFYSLFFTLNSTPTNLNNYKITTTYLDWPIHFDVHPRKDDVLLPQMDEYYPTFSNLLTSAIPNYEAHHYRLYAFIYDFSYPVLIEIRDENAFNGKGYSFFFAYEVNVRKNLDVRDYLQGLSKIPIDSDVVETEVSFKEDNKAQPLPVPDVGLTPDYDPEAQEEIETYPNKAIKSLFCDEDQKLTGDYNIKAINKKTGELLEEVDIFYGCGKYKECNIGYTIFNSAINESILTGKLPLCEGGYLAGIKEGYFGVPKKIDVKKGIGENITLQMEPFRKVKVGVKVKPMDNFEINYPLPLDKKAKLTLLRVQGNDDFYKRFSESLFFSGTDYFETQTINLVPGQYFVKAEYIDSDGTIIKQGAETIALTGDAADSLGSEIEIPDEDTEFIPITLGHLLISDLTKTELHPLGYWTLTADDLDYSGNTIEFYVPKFKMPKTLTEKSKIGDIEGYAPLIRDKIEPGFYYEFNEE